MSVKAAFLSAVLGTGLGITVIYVQAIAASLTLDMYELSRLAVSDTIYALILMYFIGPMATIACSIPFGVFLGALISAHPLLSSMIALVVAISVNLMFVKISGITSIKLNMVLEYLFIAATLLIVVRWKYRRSKACRVDVL